MRSFTVKKMRAGRGVRDPGLLAVKRSDLGTRLGIAADDDPMAVLVKVVWQVERAIDAVVGDARSRQVLRYCFNTPRDRDLNALASQKERLELLARQGGPGKSTADRLVRELSDLITAYWTERPPSPMPAAELALERRREEDHARSGGGTAGAGLNVFEQGLDDHQTGNRAGVEQQLLVQTLYFDLVDGTVPSVRTRSGAEYVPAFTRPEFLAEFRTATNAPIGREFAASGSDLVRRVVSAPGVGLVLNPLVKGHAKAFWAPEEVASMLSRGEV